MQEALRGGRGGVGVEAHVFHGHELRAGEIRHPTAVGAADDASAARMVVMSAIAIQMQRLACRQVRQVQRRIDDVGRRREVDAPNSGIDGGLYRKVIVRCAVPLCAELPDADSAVVLQLPAATVGRQDNRTAVVCARGVRRVAPVRAAAAIPRSVVACDEGTGVLRLVQQPQRGDGVNHAVDLRRENRPGVGAVVAARVHVVSVPHRYVAGVLGDDPIYARAVHHHLAAGVGNHRIRVGGAQG
ncbi:hypothetical protein D9M70_352960 [compost metagenome]